MLRSNTRALSTLKLVDTKTITLILLYILMFSIVFVIFEDALGFLLSNIDLREQQRQEFRRKMMGPPRPPWQQPLDAFWQPVAHTRNQFFVYSAFLERRREQPAAVRLIGATSRFHTDPVFCRLWMNDSHAPYILKAKVKLIKEHHNQYHGAVFVLCLLRDINPEDTVNGSVALVSHAAPEELATNLFKIIDTKPKNVGKPNLHICVRPIFGSINNVEWFVEWVELNIMLGVSHFYFYNMSIGHQLDCMLRKYKNRDNLFTILPFPSVFRDLWAEGQLASSHDCLYRSMSRANWLMLIDIDELVLPHSSGIRMLQQNPSYSKTLLALFHVLINESEKENVFAFVFRNAFFYLDFEDDPETPVPLLTSRKTTRVQLLNWYGMRSKYALRPSKVVELGIHEVEEFVYGKESVNVNLGSQIAMLHHYRNECIDIELLCTEVKPSTIDRTAHSWALRLWKRVQKRLAEISLCFPTSPADIKVNSSSPKFA